MKLKPVNRGSDGQLLGYAHWCEGCKQAHIYYTTDISPGPRWTFNGSVEKPTFTPSMRFFQHALLNADGSVRKPEITLCHYLLTDGVVNYLADSSDHELRGNHPLVDIPESYGV